MEGLYNRSAGLLEDFWGRGVHAPEHHRQFRVFGWPVDLLSNYEPVLAAADHAGPQYSRAAPLDRKAFRIQIVVRAAGADPGPIPEKVSRLSRFTGSGDWIHIDLSVWGQCFAELRRGEATIVIEPALAARPALVSQVILNTVLTNFITRHGYAMLHATALVRENRVLMLMAPHNSGKSTTALRLALPGHFSLLTDSMVYVTGTENGPQLTGFPVGRGKLRTDMLPRFPELAGRLTQEYVRDETKYILDLRAFNPDLVWEEAFYPRQVDWCLLARTTRPHTTIRPAEEQEAWDAIMVNSLHYDERGIWEENLREIEPLVGMARFWHLELGREGEDVMEVVGSMD